MNLLASFFRALGSTTGISKRHFPCISWYWLVCSSGRPACFPLNLAARLSLSFPFNCLPVWESLSSCGLWAGCISGEHAQVLYGHLYTYGRRYGLGGSGTRVFMGRGQSGNTSSVSLPLGLSRTALIITLKFATFQYEVRVLVGGGMEL